MPEADFGDLWAYGESGRKVEEILVGSGWSSGEGGGSGAKLMFLVKGWSVCLRWIRGDEDRRNIKRNRLKFYHMGDTWQAQVLITIFKI